MHLQQCYTQSPLSRTLRLCGRRVERELDKVEERETYFLVAVLLCLELHPELGGDVASRDLVVAKVAARLQRTVAAG